MLRGVQPKNQGHRRPQSRSRGHAQHVGFGKRISQDGLKGYAGNGESRSGNCGKSRSRQTETEDARLPRSAG